MTSKLFYPEHVTGVLMVAGIILAIPSGAWFRVSSMALVTIAWMGLFLIAVSRRGGAHE